MEDLWVVMPEIVLATMACIGLILDLYVSKKNRVITYLYSQLTVVVTAVCCWRFSIYGNTTTAFHEQFVNDPFAQITKLFILAIMFLILAYSRGYTRDRDIAFGEFHSLSLFCCLGMMFLVSAKSLLMIYLGLELLSLPLYALVAIQRNSRNAVEAGMKYFILGALASGLMLYGMSLLFGLSGSIQLNEVARWVHTAQDGHLQVALFAMIFILVGVAFKLGAVPFHMWVPDIYQGAPTSITLLVGSAPKIAAFAMAYRLLHDGMPSFSEQWTQILLVLAVLSLAVGNIVAIAQTNVKRLLAYSTIAHVGFLFLGLLVAPIVGYGPAMYYIVVYAVTAAAGFGVLIMLSQGYEAENLDDLKGLASKNPWLAFMMLLVAFSLAGVPPTVGFYAKFMVLNALVDSGMTWLAALAVFFSIIGAFYYLKIVRVMYFEQPVNTGIAVASVDMRILLSVNGLAILGFGLFPAPLFMACQNVFANL
ncbi:MAG: NADH-quinone oxidoreductase subunit NuoN [Candidatus Berkiella sp.]